MHCLIHFYHPQVLLLYSIILFLVLLLKESQEKPQLSKIWLQFYFHDIPFFENDDARVTLEKFFYQSQTFSGVLEV